MHNNDELLFYVDWLQNLTVDVTTFVDEDEFFWTSFSDQQLSQMYLAAGEKGKAILLSWVLFRRTKLEHPEIAFALWEHFIHAFAVDCPAEFTDWSSEWTFPTGQFKSFGEMCNGLAFHVLQGFNYQTENLAYLEQNLMLFVCFVVCDYNIPFQFYLTGFRIAYNRNSFSAETISSEAKLYYSGIK
jgi:hypothetical protein